MLLHHLFIENAKKNPKGIAIFEQHTGKEVSYGKLLLAALIFKDVFARYSGKFIGIMIPPSAGCVIALLGTIFSGKTPVLINYSTGAIENSKYAQKKCGFQTIITSKKLLERLSLKPIKGMVFMEDLASNINIFQKLKAKVLSRMPLEYLKRIVGKGDGNKNLCVLFTSGSEKDPKAVQLTHKNIMHNVTHVKELLALDEKEIFIANLPYFHVFGLTVNLWLPLIIGAKIVTVVSPLDYRLIVNTVKKYKITILVSTPTFLYGYLQKAQPGDFASLRYLISGADKLPNQIRDEYLKLHGHEILEGYGTTETSPVISLNTPNFNKRGSVGKPLPGVQIKITDLETGTEMPRGEEGKILVKGDLVMKGYFNDIEHTSYRIRDGWYDTGDMGIHDEEGYLHHRGRLRRFVKIGGEMLSLVKIEEAINELLPGETICCVVDIPDPIKGSEIVAVVTTKEINQKEMKKKLAKSLPAIAIPKTFKVMDELPMAPSGKVNFRAVEDICRNMRPEDS